MRPGPPAALAAVRPAWASKSQRRLKPTHWVPPGFSQSTGVCTDNLGAGWETGEGRFPCSQGPHVPAGLGGISAVATCCRVSRESKGQAQSLPPCHSLLAPYGAEGQGLCPYPSGPGAAPDVTLPSARSASPGQVLGVGEFRGVPVLSRSHSPSPQRCGSAQLGQCSCSCVRCPCRALPLLEPGHRFPRWLA